MYYFKTSARVSSRVSGNQNTEFLHVLFQNECKGFIRVFKHEETLEILIKPD